MSIEDRKREAAEAVVRLVHDDMVVGLGTGSTAFYAIEALIRRHRDEGLRIRCIPTSSVSARQAREGGLPLTDFAAVPFLDITIDGADEIDIDTLDLVKGLGGALLWEKIVAAATRTLVIIADDRKLVSGLGATVKVPVEVVPFGWQATSERLTRLGATPILRVAKTGGPFRTDENNLILDCVFGPIPDAMLLERALSDTVGVVETGLFIGMADIAFVATPTGVRELRPA